MDVNPAMAKILAKMSIDQSREHIWNAVFLLILEDTMDEDKACEFADRAMGKFDDRFRRST